MAEVLDLGFVLKNEKHFPGEFMQGTPDVILKDMLIDVKCPWDGSTFPLFEEELPEKDYYWQAQVYMHLTNTKKYKVVYVLMDTPDLLVMDEYNRLGEERPEFEEFKKKFIFSHLPDNQRIKVFDIERKDEDVKKIEQRVKGCRLYIDKLMNNLK